MVKKSRIVMEGEESADGNCYRKFNGDHYITELLVSQLLSRTVGNNEVYEQRMTARIPPTVPPLRADKACG